MKLYNGLTNQVETFVPQDDVVTIYVCGITPYDTTHLGHAFTYTSADLLIRFLEYQGYAVRYVQNVTDIDDDILRKARAVGEDWLALGNRWTAHFIEDMISLNVRPPDHFPRATDVIPEIVSAVEELLNTGVAYEASGSVYFRVKSWPDFGKLSALPYDEMLTVANERGNLPDDPHKQDPLDFVLWQAKSGDEPSWESPWGRGRPGWHIECSTMAGKFLGKTIDIHSGGADLEFPHHECEIAQAEAIMEARPFTRFWMHAAMVHHEGEKMSKSLGNLVMVRDLLRTWSPDTLRLYLGSYNYRQTWSYDESRLKVMSELAAKIQAACRIPVNGSLPETEMNYMERFEGALEDDLNTPAALAVIQELTDQIMELSRSGPVPSKLPLALQTLGRVFGLQMGLGNPEAFVRRGWELHLDRFRN